jgi:hypothetical protein
MPGSRVLRTKAKGKNKLPRRNADVIANTMTHPYFCLLPLAFCLLTNGGLLALPGLPSASR